MKRCPVNLIRVIMRVCHTSLFCVNCNVIRVKAPTLNNEITVHKASPDLTVRWRITKLPCESPLHFTVELPNFKRRTTKDEPNSSSKTHTV